MQNDKKVKLEFSIRDDFGDKSVYKTSRFLDEEYEDLDVFYLIRAFKKFLICAGYSVSIADRVTYVGITDNQKDEIAI